MTKKISARAEKAIEVLKNEGRLVERLEKNSYTGRVQFQVRLMTKNFSVVKGVGRAALEELRRAGLVVMAPGGHTSVSTYFVLK